MWQSGAEGGATVGRGLAVNCDSPILPDRDKQGCMIM